MEKTLLNIWKVTCHKISEEVRSAWLPSTEGTELEIAKRLLGRRCWAAAQACSPQHKARQFSKRRAWIQHLEDSLWFV